MLPRWIAVAVLGAALLHTGAVQAQALDDPGSDRRGLYVRIGGGPGYTSGDYRYTGMSKPGFGVPVRQLTFETPLHGAHAEFAAAVGYAVAPGLALAASGAGRIVPVPSSEWIGSTELATTVIASLGGVIDFFPLPADGAHFIGGAGWATGAFASGHNDDASFDNIVYPEAVSGPSVEAGIGYRLAARFDLLVRGSYAWLESTHSEYRPLGATVLASWLLF
jgi:hypothetical protein